MEVRVGFTTEQQQAIWEGRRELVRHGDPTVVCIRSDRFRLERRPRSPWRPRCNVWSVTAEAWVVCDGGAPECA